MSLIVKNEISVQILKRLKSTIKHSFHNIERYILYFISITFVSSEILDSVVSILFLPEAEILLEEFND